jgi:hypothetical protein
MGSSRIFIALTHANALLLIIHPGNQNNDIFHAFLFVTICHASVAQYFFSFLNVLFQFQISLHDLRSCSNCMGHFISHLDCLFNWRY